MPRYEGPTQPNLAAAEKAKAAAAAKAKATQIRRNVVGTYGGAISRYKPPEKEQELIGVQDAVLFWASESGIDNSTDDAGNSGLHKYIFDTTTYADKAQIKLLNDSGATQYVRAAAIKAKPVIRKNAWEQDSFVDYQDIFFNGENIFEFGNNFVVTKAQLESLTDYYAKALGAIQGNAASPKNKHIYVLSIPGRCWHFEPGEWYVVQIGSAGEKEYIDSVCECYNVSVESDAGGLGTTLISFREVEQNWVKDSNAVARYLATGDPKWKPANFGRVVVAARDYLGTADYYCDGAADNVEIQAAIDYLSGTFGGGLVELTEGQFNTTAAIDMGHDNMLLRGKGYKTIIEKNCNDHGIKSTGTTAVPIEGINISNLKITANASDTYIKYLIYANHCNNATIDHVWIYDAPYQGIIVINSNDCSIIHNKISYCSDYAGMQFSGERAKIIGNLFESNGYGIFITYLNKSTLSANECYSNKDSGFYLDHSHYNSITGNIAISNGNGGADAGIYLVTSSHNVITGNMANDNNSYGINLSNATCVNNVVTGNRAMGNTTANFNDTGDGTVDSGNDWHGKPGTVAETIEVTDTAAGTVV